ncbi:MAG: phosphoglycerate dehydrogenase [Clostridiales bacterium]|jgi:D-3-phosphoglycerate dehydrogenase|nr:phosphoglycerate dehydrogenase [Clostridiales bacterium]
MHDILALNKISTAGLKNLPADRYAVLNDCENPDGILVRSFKMHDFETGSNLLAVARAGAGTNNIPVKQYAEKGVVVFNTPGANANAVKELVIAGLILSSRKIIQGAAWVQAHKSEHDLAQLVEKEKSEFTGPEIFGKKLGVIGLGAIGALVANAAYALGMEVYGFDPFISVDSAWKLSVGVNKTLSIEAIFSTCDYVSIHAPLTDETKNLFSGESFSLIKPGLRLLNFSRGELIDNATLKKALDDGRIASYTTDFPTPELLTYDNVVAIPHLGASTPESEENCAAMAAAQLREYIDFGNISNSVNFPDCSRPYTGKKRICALHRNVPNVVASLSKAVADRGVNIDNMTNNSKGDYAYTMLDVDANINDGVENNLKSIEGVLRTRII